MFDITIIVIAVVVFILYLCFRIRSLKCENMELKEKHIATKELAATNAESARIHCIRESQMTDFLYQSLWQINQENPVTTLPSHVRRCKSSASANVTVLEVYQKIDNNDAVVIKTIKATRTEDGILIIIPS